MFEHEGTMCLDNSTHAQPYCSKEFVAVHSHSPRGEKWACCCRHHVSGDKALQTTHTRAHTHTDAGPALQRGAGRSLARHAAVAKTNPRNRRGWSTATLLNTHALYTPCPAARTSRPDAASTQSPTGSSGPQVGSSDPSSPHSSTSTREGPTTMGATPGRPAALAGPTSTWSTPAADRPGPCCAMAWEEGGAGGGTADGNAEEPEDPLVPAAGLHGLLPPAPPPTLPLTTP
jgi:hypothetical protein